VGRPFVSLPFDYLVVGGGLSLALTAYLLWGGGPTSAQLQAQLPALILLSNSAHFAASTVRLYSRRDSFQSFPFLTMVLPLVSVAVLSAAVLDPGTLGYNLQALYLSWSPYHYAAQAYGLTLMYAYRSGSTFTAAERVWLRLSCLCPFLFAFVGPSEAGLGWLVPGSLLGLPIVESVRAAAASGLRALSFLLPAGLFLWLLRGPRPRLPLLSLLIMVTNGIWWITLSYMEAFVWATIFHGLQYLSVAIIFHVREQLQTPGNTTPWWGHALRFYLASLALGFALFQVWPYGYVLLGFTLAQSVLLVAAVINIHHFIVDAYIWRLRRDPNLAVVTAAAVPTGT
jgi:hypothetical protein